MSTIIDKPKRLESQRKVFVFGKENFKLFFIGLALVMLGFILMVGGGSDEFNEFNEDALFSFRRITLAPALVIGGYVVIIFAIMRPGKKQQNQNESH